MKRLDYLKQFVDYAGDDCVRWPFSHNNTGYGQVAIAHGDIQKAHRVMCELAHGAPPTPKHHAAHSCRYRDCINPSHLSWKTSSENQLDRCRDGTTATNRYGSGGKLTNKEKDEIIAARGTMTQAALAEKYGVHFQTVSRLHLRGYKNNPKLRPFQPDEDAVIIGGRRVGTTIKQIAERLGRSYGSVDQRIATLRRRGVLSTVST